MNIPKNAVQQRQATLFCGPTALEPTKLFSAPDQAWSMFAIAAVAKRAPITDANVDHLNLQT
jgi:hypothetical protein